MASNRIERINEEIQRELSDLLRRLAQKFYLLISSITKHSKTSYSRMSL